MELIIKQSKFKLNFEYEVYDKSSLIYTAKTNRIIIPTFRKIYLYEPSGKEICSLKQQNLLKLILGALPFMSSFSFSVSPYIYYYNFIEKGYLREKIIGDGYIYGQIDGIEYEMWEHTSTDISIHSNEKQIGLIKRMKFKEYDCDQYRILFNSSLKKHLAVMFCLLADALWHTSDTEIYSISWEFTVELTGKKLDKNWVPED